MVRDLVSTQVSVNDLLELSSTLWSSARVHGKHDKSQLRPCLWQRSTPVGEGTRYDSPLRAAIDTVNDWVFLLRVKIVWLIEHALEIGFPIGGFDDKLLRRAPLQRL